VNPVLILSYNDINDLHQCIESVRRQDIPTKILVVDNASSDGSREYLEQANVETYFSHINEGVSAGWNRGLRWVFREHDYCLVLNQDLILPSYFFSELLFYNAPFITGKPVDNPMEIGPLTASPEAEKARREAGLEPHPCFSAFLIRKACWDTVGVFDTDMKSWSGDCDYHARGHRKGVGMYKAKTPFYHLPGTTTRMAPAWEQEEFIRQANRDRAVFRSKHGVIPGTPEYSDLFKPELFGVDL
jgi:GT2 family glycosyltransferase